MKSQYTTPQITVDPLLKTDVLTSSFETDNNYAKSRDVFNGDFAIESIL